MGKRIALPTDFKTIHENKVMINPPQEKDLNILEKYNKIKEQIFEYIDKQVKATDILSLDRYDNEWGYIVKQEKGNYILLEDVLALFSAKKE